MRNPIYLLDTNIISEIAKSNPNPKIANKLSEVFSQCAISTTTWNSLLFGLENMPEGKLKDYYSDFLFNYIQSKLPILPYDSHCAAIQADIRSKLRENGILMDYEDTQNAAIAISNQMVLITKNTIFFEAIKQVNSVFYCESWEE